MTYRMVQILMTSSELEGHFCRYDWQTRRAVSLQLLGQGLETEIWICFLFKLKTLTKH